MVRIHQEGEIQNKSKRVSFHKSLSKIKVGVGLSPRVSINHWGDDVKVVAKRGEGGKRDQKNAKHDGIPNIAEEGIDAILSKGPWERPSGGEREMQKDLHHERWDS